MFTFEFLRKLSLIVFFILLLFGCSKNTQNKNNTNNTENIYKISMDTVQIPVDEKYLGSYTSYTAIENDYLYGRNHLLSTIDVFDLSAGKAIKNIPIQKEGPNGIPIIDNFVVNDREIILDGRTHFILLDFNGVIVQKIAKSDLNIENKYKEYTIDKLRSVSITNFISLCYLSKSNELIIPLYNKSILNQKSRYAGFCAVAVNLDTKEAEILPIPYPEIFKGKPYYGNLDEIQLTAKGDSIVYNFPNSSEIHLFNRKTKQISDYKIDSKYTSNRSEKLDFQADRSSIMNHYLKSTFFHRVVYDPYRNLFFRLHTSKCESDRFLEDRNFYLTIMNDSFEKLDEITLPSTIYPVYNVSKKGLVFQFLNTPDEDYFTYLLLRFGDEEENQVTTEIDIPKSTEKTFVEMENINLTPEVSEPVVPEKEPVAFPVNKDISLELLVSYVEQNLIYPEDALKNGIAGNVHMLIQYDSCGIVFDRRMITGCGNKEMETEAWRIVNSIEKVKTNKEGGFGFPIIFNIEKYKNGKQFSIKQLQKR